MEVYGSLADDVLVDLLKSDDQAAFAEIFERYNSLLYMHAYKKLQDREEAKDVVQEVFTSLWDKRFSLFLKSNLPGMLYTSIHHKILDKVAHQKTAGRYIDHLQHYLEQSYKDADHLVREKQLNEIIEHEIAALPSKMRVVFEMSRKQHLTHKEIAEQLGISEETVRSQVKNALRILRAKLGPFAFLIFLIRF